MIFAGRNLTLPRLPVAEAYLGILLIAESLGAWLVYLYSGNTIGGLLLNALGVQPAIPAFDTANSAAYIEAVISNAQAGTFVLQSVELILEPIVAAVLLWDGLTSRKER